MKIIFPLDFSYTFVYALFNILSTFIRSKRSEYGQLVYVRTYDGIILVNKILLLENFFKFFKNVDIQF